MACENQDLILENKKRIFSQRELLFSPTGLSRSSQILHQLCTDVQPELISSSNSLIMGMLSTKCSWRLKITQKALGVCQTLT